VSSRVLDVLADFTLKIPQACQGRRVPALRRRRLEFCEQRVKAGHLCDDLRTQGRIHLFQEVVVFVQDAFDCGVIEVDHLEQPLTFHLRCLDFNLARRRYHRKFVKANGVVVHVVGD
jgi:hypothetical protein